MRNVLGHNVLSVSVIDLGDKEEIKGDKELIKN